MNSFAELIEKVNKARASEIPFVIYRKPDSSMISCLIQNDSRLQFVENYSESGFIMAPFLGADQRVLFSRDNTSFYGGTYYLEPPEGESFPGMDFRGDTYEAQRVKHLKLVEKGIVAIDQNKVIKVVLSRSEVITLKDIDLSVIFRKLLLKYPLAFVYVWYHPEIGLWAGASPESFLIAKEAHFSTMALAGTQSFAGKEDMTWGAKEVREQQIVTDHIVKELSGMQIKVSSPYTKKAGNLMHICTDIHGKLAGENNLSTLIQKLHPTAAVCGLPKKEAQEFILAHEGYDRSFYTGFLGELNYKNPGSTDFTTEGRGVSETNLYVNLRCMQLISEPEPAAVLYMGGGITKGSLPELEWEETVEKSKVMKSVLLL